MEKASSRLDLVAILLLLVLCTSWGFQHVAIKVTNQGISPLVQCGIRSLGAGVLVWIWMLVSKQPLWKKDGTLWWGIAAGALFAVEFILIFWGLTYTNACRAIIFVYTSPFVVALGAQLFIPGERLRPIQILGLCSAFAGIVTAFGESMGLPTYQILIGDLMSLVAAVFWGATTVLIKASPLAKINPSKTLLYQLAVSAVVLPAAALAAQEPGITLMTPLIFWCLFYQTVWVAGITYIAWFWLIKHYPASRLASFTFLTPLLGVFAGGILLDENISHQVLIAMVLVGVGIYWVNCPSES